MRVQELRETKKELRLLKCEKEGLDMALELTIKESAVLLEKLEKSSGEFRKLERAYLGETEKLRRQNEILGDTRRELIETVDENEQLVRRLTKMQSWSDRLNDEQTKQIMRQLYHDLERWAKNHFHRRNFEGLSRSDALSWSSSDDLSTFYAIYSTVSHGIFEVYLSRMMVGVINFELQDIFRQIYGEIRRACPTHVTQNWHSAMSTALSSIGAEEVEADYKAFIDTFETQYGQYSSTDPEKRREQLEVLLRRFVEFKGRLEQQIYLYTFEWISPASQFSEGKMKNFTGLCSSAAVVQRTLCPVLYKVPPEGELILVEKGVVTVTPYIRPLEPEPDATKENIEVAYLELEDGFKMDVTPEPDPMEDSLISLL
ncbi:hypothetical protein N7478_011727 [Penicillium angulare]|uniref:uncharacterized protein n=1 Tax=Penicillium angulare TaxID=116970 RepID=UPI00254120B9|nr:uncharacterized protein N7478_011727 [Penicillium angulare]KAJ5261132.1 hypothetical protein N7478_011727 [Penicillium angulare]